MKWSKHSDKSHKMIAILERITKEKKEWQNVFAHIQLLNVTNHDTVTEKGSKRQFLYFPPVASLFFINRAV